MGKLATVADSAGVGIRLLRYRCNGTRNAVVRCEKCCRKAFEAWISKRSDKWLLGYQETKKYALARRSPLIHASSHRFKSA